MSWASIAAETQGLIKKVEAYKPTTPSSTSLFRVGSSGKTAALSRGVQPDHDRAAKWLAGLKTGPMARAGRNLYPYGLPNETKPFSVFDFRYIQHYTFPLKTTARVLKEFWAVKDAAQLYRELLRHTVTSYGPGVSNKTSLKIEGKGVRRFNFVVTGTPHTNFDNTDLALLEIGISAGTWGMDRLLFANNTHLPEAKAALDELNDFNRAFKERQTLISSVYHPGKPWWWTTHALAHAVMNYAGYLYSDYLLTGDKSSLEGYEHIAAQILDAVTYVNDIDGSQLAFIPHFIPGRNNDLGWKRLSGPQGAQDATYCETFIEGAIGAYWAGAPFISADFLAAYGNTMMKTTAPDGLNAAGMAEAICGSLKEGDGSRDNSEVASLYGGKRLLETPGIRANRMGTRGPSVNLKRAGHFACTPFSVAKTPALRGEYLANLSALAGLGSGTAALWKLVIESGLPGYLERG